MKIDPGLVIAFLLAVAGLSLWPLGLMLIAVLSLPVAGVAAITRIIKRRPA